MEYRRLGKTEIDVSIIGLGTMTWGQQNSESEAHSQMDYAIEQGVNFFDAAELYPIPPKAESQGRTEEYIGRWLQSSGKRDDIIIATKVRGRGDWASHIRGKQSRLNSENIEKAVDDSLKRLQIDYIDLYQIHWPDRNTNFFGALGYDEKPESSLSTPIAETMEALETLVKKGKIRHIGVSNETPWGLMQYLNHSSLQGSSRIASIQNPYSLLNRSFEVGLAEFSHRENVGLLAYSPLAFGALSGKYLDGQQPENARLSLFKEYQRYNNPQGQAAIRAYVGLAMDNGLVPTQMALAYLLSRPFMTSAIIGATTMAQLQTNINSINCQLDEAVLSEIEVIHQQYSNPCP